MDEWRVRPQTGKREFGFTGEIEAFLDNPEGETVAHIVTTGELAEDEETAYQMDCAALTKIEAALNASEEKRPVSPAWEELRAAAEGAAELLRIREERDCGEAGSDPYCRLRAALAAVQDEQEQKPADEPAAPAQHPVQPLITDEDGRLRFKQNAIVRYLLDAGPFDMNQLATLPVSREDRVQFAQLIGYSLSGFGELSYVTDEDYRAAQDGTR